MFIRAFTLPVLSGFLYWLSSPAFSYPLLVWVCLVPLGLSLNRVSPGEGFSRGFAYGLCLWLLAIWWTRNCLVIMVGLPSWQAWGYTVMLSAFHAVPYGVFGCLAGKFRLMESRSGSVLAAASLAALVSWYPQVFPGSEAHNLYSWPLLIQVLDLGGAPLLLFFVYLVNFQIVRGVRALKTGGSPFPALVSAVLALAFLMGYGGYRLHTLHEEMRTAKGGQQVTALSIQPNIPVSQRVQDVPPEDMSNDMKTALTMTRDAVRAYPRADLVVLPEVPFAYNCRTEAGRDIPPLARETGKAFTLPCASALKEGGPEFYNSVTFIDRCGSPGEEYRKLILVPFGEYIPLEEQFPFLRRIFPGAMAFVKGDRGEVVYDLGQGRRLIPCLCYEAIFSGHIRRFVNRGGNVLINMVDDAWFGKSPASVIHMSLALFRTVEYRIPMVRVTNSGVGIFAQATGEIVPGSKTPLFQKAATSHTLYIPPRRSPYARWGNIFLYGLTVAAVIGLVWTGRR